MLTWRLNASVIGADAVKFVFVGCRGAFSKVHKYMRLSRVCNVALYLFGYWLLPTVTWAVILPLVSSLDSFPFANYMYSSQVSRESRDATCTEALFAIICFLRKEKFNESMNLVMHEDVAKVSVSKMVRHLLKMCHLSQKLWFTCAFHQSNAPDAIWVLHDFKMQLSALDNQSWSVLGVCKHKCMTCCWFYLVYKNDQYTTPALNRELSEW